MCQALLLWADVRREYCSCICWRCQTPETQAFQSWLWFQICLSIAMSVFLCFASLLRKAGGASKEAFAHRLQGGFDLGEILGSWKLGFSQHRYPTVPPNPGACPNFCQWTPAIPGIFEHAAAAHFSYQRSLPRGPEHLMGMAIPKHQSLEVVSMGTASGRQGAHHLCLSPPCPTRTWLLECSHGQGNRCFKSWLLPKGSQGVVNIIWVCPKEGNPQCRGLTHIIILGIFYASFPFGGLPHFVWMRMDSDSLLAW